MPFMFGAMGLPKVLFPPIESWMQNIGVAFWIISLTGTLFNVVFSCIGLLGFIAGSAFVFGLMEDIGYMARVSYVFESAMSRFNLHGKSIMAFMMSFGCSIGGSLSTRVIDTWGQRMLTMAIAWAVPCAGTWGVISVFGTAFFGINTIWVLLALFASSVAIMFITAKVFAPKLIDKKQHYGLIMELPPYHKPKWGSIFRFVFSRIGGFAKKAFTYFLLVTAVFWILAYSSDGNIEHSLIYKFGKAVEPVTIWVGLRWQTLIAFICSLMGKEGALGALSSIFGASSHVVGLDGEVSADLATQMSSLLTKPEALAFMFAFYFNVPCFVAVLQVKEESHSWKWTLRMMGFYLVIALIMGALAYYVGQLIF
jgi:ferrous iron transport protein B